MVYVVIESKISENSCVALNIYLEIFIVLYIYIYVNKDIYIFLLCEIREPERNDIPVTTTQLVFGFWF